jgi:hypothetical protein
MMPQAYEEGAGKLCVSQVQRSEPFVRTNDVRGPWVNMIDATRLD